MAPYPSCPASGRSRTMGMGHSSTLRTDQWVLLTAAVIRNFIRQLGRWNAPHILGLPISGPNHFCRTCRLRRGQLCEISSECRLDSEKDSLIFGDRVGHAIERGIATMATRRRGVGGLGVRRLVGARWPPPRYATASAIATS